MNFCPNCGIEILTPANFCGECGADMRKFKFRWPDGKGIINIETQGVDKQKNEDISKKGSADNEVAELDLLEAIKRGEVTLGDGSQDLSKKIGKGGANNIIRLDDIEDEKEEGDGSVIERSKLEDADELLNIRRICPMCGDEYLLTEDILEQRPLKITCKNCGHGHMLR